MVQSNPTYTQPSSSHREEKNKYAQEKLLSLASFNTNHENWLQNYSWGKSTNLSNSWENGLPIPSTHPLLQSDRRPKRAWGFLITCMPQKVCIAACMIWVLWVRCNGCLVCSLSSLLVPTTQPKKTGKAAQYLSIWWVYLQCSMEKIFSSVAFRCHC